MRTNKITPARAKRMEMAYYIQSKLRWSYPRFRTWYLTPHRAFDGLSPHQMILKGRSDEVITYVKWLLDV